MKAALHKTPDAFLLCVVHAAGQFLQEDQRARHGVRRHLVTKHGLVPAPANLCICHSSDLSFKLGGRPVLSADLDVGTAGSERKRPEM